MSVNKRNCPVLWFLHGLLPGDVLLPRITWPSVDGTHGSTAERSWHLTLTPLWRPPKGSPKGGPRKGPTFCLIFCFLRPLNIVSKRPKYFQKLLKILIFQTFKFVFTSTFWGCNFYAWLVSLCWSSESLYCHINVELH